MYANMLTFHLRLEMLVKKLRFLFQKRTEVRTIINKIEQSSSCPATEAEDCLLNKRDFATQRCDALHAKLGDEAYSEAINLVSEVLKIRQTCILETNSRPSSSSFSGNDNLFIHRGKQKRSLESHFLHGGTLSSWDYRTPNTIPSTKLPEEVISIYLRTRLVEAMSAVRNPNTTSLQISRVNNVKWDTLIAEAKFNIIQIRLLLNRLTK